jgi:Phage integrase family
VLAKDGIRKVRLHDLRHTFGSLLIQAGASIVYVKGQMGHGSIQVTVDIYGHLILVRASRTWIDLMWDWRKRRKHPQTGRKRCNRDIEQVPAEIADLIGGGGRTRTYDLRIMRPSL